MPSFSYPPLPAPWDSSAQRNASELLQRIVYGSCPPAQLPDVVAHTPVISGRETVHIPFPVLIATPVTAGPWPALVGISFQDLQNLDETGAWPIERITDSGWAIAIAYVGDIEPDDPALSTGNAMVKWAQGLQAMIRILESDERFDPKKLVAIGHSRFGKAALLAAAMDPSLAGVVGIQSGCGGAAPSRTAVGETVKDITGMFPHWFSPEFAAYADDTNRLPLDQHWLLALCANRPTMLCNADEDLWANPLGQHEMLQLAAKAHGTGLAELQIGETVGDLIAHFYRRGKHQVIESDWDAILGWLNRW